MYRNKNYYGDFLNSDENISTNILANRLEKLEIHNLIIKTVDTNNRSKNVYTLTQKGIDLLPMLLEIITWSAKYDAKTETPENFITNLSGGSFSMYCPGVFGGSGTTGSYMVMPK